MKIVVNIVVPSISEKVDVILPDFVKVQDLIEPLAEVLREFTSDEYVSSGEEVLSNYNKGYVLDREKSLSQNGIGNGDVLMFI